MNSRILLAGGAALLISSVGLAANEPTSGQAGEPRPETAQRASSEDPYTDFNKRVQDRLRQLGYYSGPVNGDFGPNTQAALAQFQLSVPLPASGMLDAETLDALNVPPEAKASTDASAESSAGATMEASANSSSGGSAPSNTKQ